jgi:hypothetical protein
LARRKSKLPRDYIKTIVQASFPNKHQNFIPMKNYLLTFAVLLSVVSLAVMQANAAVTVEEATTDASAQYWLNPAYEQYYSLV